MIDTLSITISRSCAGHVDAHAERRPDRHQHAEQQEGDEDGRAIVKNRADLPPQQVAPDERQELHATASVDTSTPLSRCSVRLARAAACGSCVTMTIVLP